jgi:hypothetical protein
MDRELLEDIVFRGRQADVLDAAAHQVDAEIAVRAAIVAERKSSHQMSSGGMFNFEHSSIENPGSAA